MRGSKEEVEDLFLEKAQKEFDWMANKYGHPIIPWSITIDMPNVCSGKSEQGIYEPLHEKTKF